MVRMECDFRNCKNDAYTCGNVITYNRDGEYETVCLCKRHIGMLVPKELRDIEKKGNIWVSVIPPEKQIERLERMIETIKQGMEAGYL